MIGKVLGHKQARTTEIYAHLADDPIRMVAESTANKIVAAIERGRPGDKGEIVELPKPRAPRAQLR